MAHKALQNIEAEKSVLGAVLLRNGVLHNLDGLTAGDFYSMANKRIFETMLAMDGNGEAIDYLTLEDRLKAGGEIEKVGGPGYISSLTDGVPTLFNVEHYARMVREKSARRRLMVRLRELEQKVIEDEPLPDISGQVAAAAEIGMLNNSRPSSLSEAFEQLERYQSGGSKGFLLTGFQSLDDFAPAPDELVVVAGRPSIGKTALAIALGEQIARRGEGCLFISIEMSGEALNLRRLAAATGIPMTDLRRQGGIRQKWNFVVKSFDDMKRSPFHVVSGSFTPAELAATIRSEKAKHDIRAVFVDHLGLLTFPKSERRDLELGYATQTFARLSKDIGVVVFLLCQLNRGLESRQEHRPRLSDLRDSGRIEEDADSVWLLFRENRYDDRADDTFEVIVGKNRNGPVGVAKLRFYESIGKFSE